MNTDEYEFSAETADALLRALDRELRQQGIHGALFIVGGAAVARNMPDPRFTQDVDALGANAEILSIAASLARRFHVVPTWLNSRAKMRMPPLPPGVLDAPHEPGLRITYASDGFLLATKLVAQRAKDYKDILFLCDRLGLRSASAEVLESHVRSYYTDEGQLEMIIDGPDAEEELTLMCKDVERMLRQHFGGTNG